MKKLYIPVFSISLFLSAILLFSVQPMFSRMILPLLGGSPQVWNIAMLFFQSCLLMGYAYAHGTTYLFGVRTQSILHILILGIITVFLPLHIPQTWLPDTALDPTLWQLSVMAYTVGAPFFILAASAPMFQRWFSSTDHPDSHNPYFLYGASNLGSVGALLAYPFIIEPLWDLKNQSLYWMYGYLALIAFTVLSSALVWNNSQKQEEQTNLNNILEVTYKQRFLWIFLAFIPSSLMLGVTTLITEDIASVPLLWIIPLALYVSTFIIAFSKKPILDAFKARILFDIFLITIVILQITDNAGLSALSVMSVYILVFFFASLMCHCELVKAKPHPNHLTEFYLLLSLGGALGGVFNAIIAPQLLIVPIEFMLILTLCFFVRFISSPPISFKEAYFQIYQYIFIKNKRISFEWIIAATVFILLVLGVYNRLYPAVFILALQLLFLIPTRKSFAFLATAVLFLNYFGTSFIYAQKLLHINRNFFGVLKVTKENDQHMLIHGTTNHGTQLNIDGLKPIQVSYYGSHSAIANIVKYYDKIKAEEQNFAVLGLGAGVMACFKKEGRHYDFYEINPEVARIAQDRNLFTFLSDCKTPYNIILGDGRLKIKDARAYSYDFILADAFSSDSIPIHLVTKEAVMSYLDKLKTDGALVFHISNRYLDLEPVLTKIAKELDYPILGKASLPKTEIVEGKEVNFLPTHVVVITKSKELQNFLQAHRWTAGIEREGIKAWTDQYSNIVSILGKPKVTGRRFKMEQEHFKKQKEKEEDAISSP